MSINIIGIKYLIVIEIVIVIGKGGGSISRDYWALIRFEVMACYHQNLFWGVWLFQISFPPKK